MFEDGGVRVSVTTDQPPVVDRRARGALVDADPRVAGVWTVASEAAWSDVPPVGLLAGERPAADVEVLGGAVAVVEYELARRMHAAAVAGSLPLTGEGSVLLARGWSAGWARRLARAGGFAAQFPHVAAVWAAGVIRSEHVQALARHGERLSPEQMSAVIEEMAPLWGQLSPHAVGVFVTRVVRMLHPPEDPEPAESAAHDARFLSFAVTSDSVLLSGELPRMEGEAVIAAVEAFGERLRSQADHVPAGARRADGLVALVNAAHAADAIPTRGGLPVSVSVTVDTSRLGDQVWSTSRGHTLTAAERRFTACDALVTPVLVGSAAPDGDGAEQIPAEVSGGRGPGVRIAALAAALLGSRLPLSVGRTARSATPAQRRALAARDRGCIIPGCQIPAEACQAHHVHDWAVGGRSDLDNLALLCWAHHRQVDLGMWTITPAPPDGPIPEPESGAPPGTPWPANNAAPWTIVRTPRARWRT